MHRVLLISLLCLPGALQAQSIRGVVVGQGDTVGVSGVVVLLLDGASNVAARSLTNERGEYRLAVPGAGSYRIRTMRIGYRPVVSASIQLAGDQDVQHAPLVAGSAVTLDTVTIVGRNVCRMYGDSAVATYALWEQARTALTATDLTARARTMTATIVTYERSTEPGSGRIRQQSSGIRTGFTSRPWRSRAIDSLRSAGYIETSANGWVSYFAPDLDVLLSSAFLEDHCFRIARGSDARRVGLEFEPVEARKEMPEIRGVVWLDRKSAELQKMEFRYTNLRREQERHAAGGEMDFVRMKNGAWAISRWHIRMPVLMERPGQPSGVPGMPAEPERRVTDVRIAGGEISWVALGADTIWSGPPLVLHGTVVDSSTDVPIGRARVALKGTRLEATTDAKGYFRIAGMLPGEYGLEVSTPAMDSVQLVQQSEILFVDGSVPTKIRLRKRALFHGLVLADSTGLPVPGAIVRLPEIGMTAKAADDGRFRLLDVPAGLHTVAIRQPGFIDQVIKIAFEANAITAHRFNLRHAPPPPVTLATAVGRPLVREFEERRAKGNGHFITRAQLDAKQNQRVADILSGVPGLRIIRSPTGPASWASSGRGKTSLDNERQPDPTSRSSGAPPACYSDIYLDGVLVYGGGPSDLFDLNSLLPAMLEGIEFYVSGSHVPPEFNRLGAACGVLLFWTRRG